MTTLKEHAGGCPAKNDYTVVCVCDGYHTFEELYDFRKLYNANLFNEWAKQDKYEVHKSHKHFDGEHCFGGGWFIVVAVLPTGQISNHYENKDWNLFQCEVTDTAKYEFDGHTPQDVLKRLKDVNEIDEKEFNIKYGLK